jgi:metal-sulfur cluster biosynthetic enzyme
MTESHPPLTNEGMREWLRPIEDPEMRMSLVDLGLIYECHVDADTGVVNVVMTLTTPTCPAADYIVGQVRDRINDHPLVGHSEVKLVFEPKWDPRTMASDEAKDKLRIW